MVAQGMFSHAQSLSHYFIDFTATVDNGLDNAQLFWGERCELPYRRIDFAMVRIPGFDS